MLALMGGEPLLRPQFAHKVVHYAAKKGFWIYIGTNARLLRPDVADRLADAGVSVFNVASMPGTLSQAFLRPWYLSKLNWNACCGSNMCMVTWSS